MLRRLWKWAALGGAAAAVLAAGLPAAAQEPPRQYNYRVESFTLDASAPQATVLRRGTLVMSDDDLALSGVLRCMDGGECLDAGGEGAEVRIHGGLKLRRASIDLGDPAVLPFGGLMIGQVGGEDQVGDFRGPAAALATCANAACTAFDVEVLACGGLRGTVNPRRMGIVLTGRLVLDAPDDWRDAPGEHSASWEDVAGAGYFTLDEESNPVCSRMRAMVEELTGQPLDLEAEGVEDTVAEAVFGAERTDGGEAATDEGAILNAASVRREGADVILTVNGYWVNRCGVETQIERAPNVKADTAVLRVYRDLPPDATCLPGVETFEQSWIVNFDALAASGIRYARINGQIIGILVG